MPDIQIIELDPKLSVDGTEVIEIQDAAGGLGSSFKTPLSNLIGPEGPPGDPGADGSDATATAGTTTTLAPGSDATVSNSGTPSDAVFDFGIPEGLKGDPGDPGADGNDGTSATVDAGTTTTGAPGSNANVTNVGTTTDAVFNFAIPAGLPGADGEDGSDGVGIPVAGGTGQVLIKASAADYDTEWSTPAGGGDVTGPASSVDSHIVTFNGTTGKLLKDSGTLLSSFATAAQGAKADTAVQPGDNVSDLVNDAGYGTGDIVGTGTVVSDNLTAFTGTTGDVVKDSEISISSVNGAIALAGTSIQPGDNVSELVNDAGYGTGNGDGDVVGPATSQDNHLAVWNGTNGELLQDSTKDVDDVVTNTGTAVSANFAAFNGGSGKLIQDAGVGSSSFVANSWLSTITSATQPGDNVSTLNNDAGYKAYYSGAALPDPAGYDEGDLFCVTT